MEIKRQEKRGSQPDNRGFSVGYDRLNRAILPVGAISPPHNQINITHFLPRNNLTQIKKIDYFHDPPLRGEP
jgi:hypothetical protein